jgi:hypothetical protein
MTPDTSRNKTSRPSASPSSPGRATQERVALAMAPTVFCPPSRIDQCLRVQPKGAPVR